MLTGTQIKQIQDLLIQWEGKTRKLAAISTQKAHLYLWIQRGDHPNSSVYRAGGWDGLKVIGGNPRPLDSQITAMETEHTQLLADLASLKSQLKALGVDV